MCIRDSGKPFGHAFDLLAFAHQSRRQQGIARAPRQYALVEHPGIGFDVRAAKILLQRSRCDTGVTSGSVTRMILVYAASCSRISGVTTWAVPRSNSRVICR